MQPAIFLDILTAIAVLYIIYLMYPDIRLLRLGPRHNDSDVIKASAINLLLGVLSITILGLIAYKVSLNEPIAENTLTNNISTFIYQTIRWGILVGMICLTAYFTIIPIRRKTPTKEWLPFSLRLTFYTLAYLILIICDISDLVK